MLRPALAMVLLLLACSPATAAGVEELSFFDLGPDPLADSVRAMEPQGLPAAGALDALADASSAFSTERTSDRTIELEEDTILRGIVLSRRSGIAMDLDDLANVDDAAARVSTDARAVTLEREDVFSALLLGVGKVSGPVTDVLTTSRRWSTSDRTIKSVELTDEDTLGGLALMARGIELDPHDLVQVNAVAQGGSRTRQLAGLSEDPRLVQNVSLPRDTAAAAATLFEADTPVRPLDLANATLRTSDNGSFSRTMELPVDIVLAALAFDANGLAVEADDLMTMRERSVVQRIGTTEIELARETVLHALLLGAQAG